MTPEISFKVVIFEQTVKKSYTYVLEYILKNIPNIFFFFLTPLYLGKADLPLPPPAIFSKALQSFLSCQYPGLHLKTA